MKRTIRIISGIILVIAGIVGCFLPGPGLLLILLGFSLILAKRPKVLIQEIIRYVREKKE